MRGGGIRDVVGFKKSGGGRAPIEASDTARSVSYARVLDILSEGEIEGPVNGLKSVLLDGTPLAGDDGSINFPGASVEFRTGSQDQDYIPGFPAVENEIGVSVELRGDTPYSRAVTNLELSAVRVRLSTPQFQRVDPHTGDVKGYRVDYQIEIATDDGAYEIALKAAFDIKVSGKYERSHRVNLPPARRGWMVRIRRLTPNANSTTIADTTTVESVTEIIDAKLRYPNTALAGVMIDASQFQRVATRSYHMRGRRVRIPSNYDPTTRGYSGDWDGTFKVGYTNNPAWVFYDMATHPRYGMGHRIAANQLDRYQLYKIARYCDELVPDGKGGQEPRMTCNVYLQSRADAYKVLADLASVFRGVTYWSASQIWAVANMPAEPVYTYTAGNVIDGKFVRQGTDRKTRYTVALVSWSDPANHYQQAVEAVEDRDGKLRYGVRQTEITAIGCTSQGQAQRVGKWALLTSRMETQEVTFSVGLDGIFALPGQIIRVADSALAGRPISGRVHAVAGRTITVDRDVKVKPGDRLIVNLPSGRNETRIVYGVSGRDVTVSSDWSASPQPEAVWAVESDDLAVPMYQVVSVAERTDDQSLRFEITVVQHEPGKFDNVDFGTRIEERPVTVIPPSIQPPPANVRLSSYSRIDQGAASTIMVVAWDAVQGAVQYEVHWRKDNGDWNFAGRTGSVNADVPGIYAGAYMARVVAINAMNVPSLPAFSALTNMQGKTTPPPAVTFLRATSQIMGIGLEWGFPEGALDTQRTELWYSTTSDRSTAKKLGDFAFPQHLYTMDGLHAGASFFFWARLVDRSGNVGPWYPDGVGVNGQSSSDATAILDYLKGEIGKEELTKELQSEIKGATDFIGDAKHQLEQLAEAVGDVKSNVERVDGVVAQWSPEWAGATDGYAGDTKKLAGVWTQWSALTDKISALARRVDRVASVAGESAAQVRVEQITRVDENTAMAQRIETTEASVGTVSAAVQENSQAIASVDGRVKAYYTLKVQAAVGGGMYVAGMSVGIDNNNGVTQSQILFQADRFGLLSLANGSWYTPFVIENGEVFINRGFIGKGWITNLMIGDVIQSNDYVAGQRGWRIDKNGSIEMNDADGGGRTVINRFGGQVYGPNGGLLVRWGRW
ncbi:host specificity protein J [Burkholderia pseudomallei]|uniref:host specificity protein J n=1 Tax=Burkholderia pseudomallei TaxID=28450 RepID=UPI00014F91EE|nr:host specificity protein J [Burkholderia pseudomallei]AGR70741.1 phage tail family protein [Burkholderia pseudomallei MSHR305]AHK66867.1 phage tail family protein [Burkholderia pseudomallei MSHR520]AIP79375.1 phage tail family protein [Burkholderia pseudomallei]APZ19449.1 host specificity protein [Burkholderia pseudomallei]APZ25642.1 host specificity protein [Burkholderia pseudomallei]